MLLALLAWLAQLCLPAAHAAVMTQQDAGGVATWCGVRSAAMSEKLAQLPDEIRQILDQDGAQADPHPDCMQFCAGSAGTGLARAAVTIQLRLAGLEDEPAPPALRAARAYASSPPARGPPQPS